MMQTAWDLGDRTTATGHRRCGCQNPLNDERRAAMRTAPALSVVSLTDHDPSMVTVLLDAAAGIDDG
jgi:hypothetical protein